MIEETDRGLPHLEGFANVEKVDILGEGVAEQAELQGQLVRDPTHLIHPGFAISERPGDMVEKILLKSCQLGGTGRPSSHARAAAV